uniref:Uncharacterized protein n=1 Tax=Timema bartmani TaxID=61472 RepID=A0A7R9ELI2_9NEOP|nr:unnamed protein product [Timema bartmani]
MNSAEVTEKRKRELKKRGLFDLYFQPTKKVSFHISHSLLMSSDRMKLRLRDWGIEVGFLQEADITSFSSGSNVNNTPRPSFTCCIVDESSKCCEPDILVPLLHDVKNLVLVGDTNQLQATVHSKDTDQTNVDELLQYHSTELTNKDLQEMENGIKDEEELYRERKNAAHQLSLNHFIKKVENLQSNDPGPSRHHDFDPEHELSNSRHDIQDVGFEDTDQTNVDELLQYHSTELTNKDLQEMENGIKDEEELYRERKNAAHQLSLNHFIKKVENLQTFTTIRTVEQEPSREQELTVPGPSREQELTGLGTSREQELTVPGSSREQEFIIPGSSREQVLTVPGPSREQEFIIPGSSREQVLTVPVPSREQELIITGSSREQVPTVQGPSREQELTVSGPSKEQELTVSGPSREQELTVPGPSGEQELTIQGSSREQESDNLDLPDLIAKDLGYAISMFDRLNSSLSLLPSNPVMFLNEQFRMHPEICCWPNYYFYEGRLTCAPFLHHQRITPLKPYLVLSLEYRQGLSRGHSNDGEADFVVEVASIALNTVSQHKLSVGIITPYNQQKETIQNKLREKYPGLGITCDTIDSVQGQERDVVIMSCVRTEGVGFLNDMSRLNVALTRARSALYICGNFTALKDVTAWERLLEDAVRRQTFKTMNLHKGGAPKFAWRESGKPFRKNNPQCNQLELNLNLPVFCSIVSCESSALDHAATEAGSKYSRVTVHNRAIPTERPPSAGDDSAHFYE